MIEKTLLQWQEAPQGILLDVRESDEFYSHHLLQAKLFPLSQLEKKYLELDPKMSYSVICHSGKRAKRAADFLEVKGFEHVTVITDGMVAAKPLDQTRLADLQEMIQQFNQERHWGEAHTPRNLATSISIEAAELLENFQWSDQAQDQQNVREELADVMIYCLNLASRLEVDVATIIQDKLKKNAQKYPLPKKDD